MARTRTAAEPSTPRPAPTPAVPAAPGWGPRLADAAVAVGFLGLTFLLGVFRLKDTDFWYHLRAGDEIRRSGIVPLVDEFTFGAAGRTWIDLHWLFQVLISWGYERGGVPVLSLAKCVITTAAVLLLLTARRRDWPLWAMVLAWLPALYVLGGRMYVRPETLSLLYLSMDLAILTRIERRPRLAYLLPVVQVLWVNTQGLFVLGPALIVMALLGAAERRGAFAATRRAWWRTVLTGSGLAAAACVLNPYGLLGAAFPIQLVRTMGAPIFRQTIAELKPIGAFIDEAGYDNFQIQMYLLTAAIGALSFLAPMAWWAITRIGGGATPPPPTAPKKRGKAPKTRPEIDEAPRHQWRPNLLRLMLYGAFTFLSVQATRNSHQFAAVVGAVTAWNVGEWGAAIARRRREAGRPPAPALWPRLVTLGILATAVVGVASGRVYRWAGEGRAIGLGEEPLWYPKDAVDFAGRPGMPDRMVCFHNGHAAFYEYKNGPGRRPYMDARLEVLGPELYGVYIDLSKAVAGARPGWSARLEAMGMPGVLVDDVHAEFAPMAATLMADPGWRCVWFDPVASVYLPRGVGPEFPEVDFAARHFRPDPKTSPEGPAATLAAARSLRNVAMALIERRRADKARPLLLLGRGYARRVLEVQPDLSEAWKLLGQMELAAEGGDSAPIARYRLPFDPVFDLASVRTTYDLRRAAEDPDAEFSTLATLATVFEQRSMGEAALPVYRRLLGLGTINKKQVEMQGEIRARAAVLQAKLGPLPPARWENLRELDSLLNARLDAGRAEAAALLLEEADRPEARPWERADRLATLRMHLGEPARARAAWQAAAGKRPAVAASRVAASYLVEGDLDAARRQYRAALEAEPRRFEALYGLAILERDAGHAGAARDAARPAVEAAPTDIARGAARAVLAEVEPYASPPAGGAISAPGGMPSTPAGR